MRVLVTGATGLIGAHAVARLLDAGFTVRVFVRDAGKLGRVLAPFGRGSGDVEIAIGDVHSPGRVHSALAACDGLLHCAGVFSPERADAARLRAVNVEGTKVALEAAVQRGVRRIVFVSSILALFPPSGPVMTAADDVADPDSLYAATKAEAERFARSLRDSLDPGASRLTIVYPAACHGPDDPTFSTGPQLVADALRSGRVLVTEGGLPYTDVRELARLLAELFACTEPPARLMAPSFFLSHEGYRVLLCRLTGRDLKPRSLPGWLLRALGRLGDLGQRLGRQTVLTREAALVLTRSVPLDDREARALLGREPVSEEASFADLLRWMVAAGHLDAEHVGRLAEEHTP